MCALLLVCASLLGCAAGELSPAATEAPESVDRSASVDTPQASELSSPEAKVVSTAVRVTAQAVVVDATPPPAAEKAVELAMQDLSQVEDIPQDAIRLVSVDRMEWSDASLGCPEPDMVYAQVITPGFLVVLEAEGEVFEYHTDTGRFVVMCPASD